MASPERPDLRGAQQPGPASPERRGSDRYVCDPDAYQHLVAIIDGSPWPAQVRNISIGGIGLIVPRQLQPGTAITIELRNTVQKFVRTLPARVAYALEHSTGDWIVGCAFAHPLTGEELQSLM